jgi:polyphosphate kinase 2 (PPK2 family)
LLRLQTELVHAGAWIKQSDVRVVAVFEGRDAAGKGGVIKRITQRVSPRIFRVVALPRRRPSGNRRSGISSATSPTFLRAVRLIGDRLRFTVKLS